MQYRLTVQWRNTTNGGWFLDVADANSIPIASGIPLVTGVNLLAPYTYLGIGGKLFVATDGNASAVPTYSNLGQTSHLYFVTQ